MILLKDGRVFASSGENGEPSTFHTFWHGLWRVLGLSPRRDVPELEFREIDSCGGMSDLLQQAIVLEEKNVEPDPDIIWGWDKGVYQPVIRILTRGKDAGPRKQAGEGSQDNQGN